MGDSRGISSMLFVGNIAENWKMWRSRFENYLQATEICKKDESVQCAQLLHYIGEEGFRIYTTFQFSEDEKNKLSKLMEKFEAHFLPKENLSFERYKFFMCRQKLEQTFEQFLTELRKQAMKCKLGTLSDGLIKCMIICGVRSEELREKLLQLDDDKSLDKTIELCMVLESSKQQSKQMCAGSSKQQEAEVDAINKMSGKSAKQHKAGPAQGNFKKWNFDSSTKIIHGCTKCGKSHKINKCPAYGKVCNTCKVRNHFSVVCNKRKNNVNLIMQNNVDENNDEYLYVGVLTKELIGENTEKSWYEVLKINNVTCKFKLDSGAMCNILPINYLKTLGVSLTKLKKDKTVLRSYTGENLCVRQM